MKWCYDACGEYTRYRGYIVIKQDHPDLIKYEITKEIEPDGELIHIGLASTVEEFKDKIKELKKTT